VANSTGCFVPASVIIPDIIFSWALSEIVKKRIQKAASMALLQLRQEVMTVLEQI
jgi:hypothetical protein